MATERQVEMADKIIIHADPDVQELIPHFLENRLQDVAAMTRALEVKDYETIRRLGHSMKGAGEGYGFDQITVIGAQLEEYAKTQKHAEIKSKIAELTLYLERVEVLYE